MNDSKVNDDVIEDYTQLRNIMKKNDYGDEMDFIVGGNTIDDGDFEKILGELR